MIGEYWDSPVANPVAHFLKKIFNENSGKSSLWGKENKVKISLRYRNLLPRYLNSSIFSFTNSACLFSIIGQPYFIYSDLLEFFS